MGYLNPSKDAAPIQARLKLKPEDFTYKLDTYGTIRAIGMDKYPGEMPIYARHCTIRYHSFPLLKRD